VPHQSLIYDEALRLVDEAQEWLFITCQYFPGGPTAKHLAAAQKRGVQVEIAYNHPRYQGTLAPVHHLHQLTQHTRGLPRSFFSGRLNKHVSRLHAKVLASERGAMVGSHNYVIQGVNFGTAELALRSSDPIFALALRSFIKDQIAKATHTVIQPAVQQSIKNGAEVSHLYK
jgi:phosphatidylserine/phosphatidylglycerophosphate/cardiolipin synthase-like enzyme